MPVRSMPSSGTTLHVRGDGALPRPRHPHSTRSSLHPRAFRLDEKPLQLEPRHFVGLVRRGEARPLGDVGPFVAGWEVGQLGVERPAVVVDARGAEALPEPVEVVGRLRQRTLRRGRSPRRSPWFPAFRGGCPRCVRRPRNAAPVPVPTGGARLGPAPGRPVAGRCPRRRTRLRPGPHVRRTPAAPAASWSPGGWPR